MPRLLLDTHAFVWWLSDVSRLTAGARAAIADLRSDVFVSAITGWEIAVKRARGRITAPENLSAIIEEKGFLHLPLTFDHAERAGNLPTYHRDPFDRFLIAQAQAEGFVLVTRDARIPLYDVRTMTA